jgi:hypothetical protein
MFRSNSTHPSATNISSNTPIDTQVNKLNIKKYENNTTTINSIKPVQISTNKHTENLCTHSSSRSHSGSNSDENEMKQLCSYIIKNFNSVFKFQQLLQQTIVQQQKLIEQCAQKIESQQQQYSKLENQLHKHRHTAAVTISNKCIQSNVTTTNSTSIVHQFTIRLLSNICATPRRILRFIRILTPICALKQKSKLNLHRSRSPLSSISIHNEPSTQQSSICSTHHSNISSSSTSTSNDKPTINDHSNANDSIQTSNSSTLTKSNETCPSHSESLILSTPAAQTKSIVTPIPDSLRIPICSTFETCTPIAITNVPKFTHLSWRSDSYDELNKDSQHEHFVNYISPFTNSLEHIFHQCKSEEELFYKFLESEQYLKYQQLHCRSLEESSQLWRFHHDRFNWSLQQKKQNNKNKNKIKKQIQKCKKQQIKQSINVSTNEI